jgi:X-Pro dipeptidyl-peptidase
LTEDETVTDPNTARDGRLAFLSAPLTGPLHISGSPSLRLRVRVDRPTTELTARLVDYGTASRINYFSSEGVRTLATESCWGPATATDDACYRDTAENVATTDHAVITRGWQDAAHYRTLRATTPLQPGRWYDIDVPISATDAILPAGHTLGLILTQSDPEFDNAEDHDATVKIDLGGSALSLPVTGRVSLPAITTAPTVTTAPVPAGPTARLATPRKLQRP